MARVTTDLGPNESLNVTRIDPKKNHPIPPYFAMGRFGTSRHRIKGVDVPHIFSTLSGKSSWFFWYLAGFREYETNLCDLRKLHMTATERGRVTRAYAELRKEKLVIRVTKGTYLINPKIILPDFPRFDAIWDKWVATCTKQSVPFE
jgi:hypothetical protein